VAVNQHSRSDLHTSSPSLHHQFQLHQPHGSSCRQTDRPTDMSIIAPTHVHLFSNWSGKPIYIKHSSFKTFDKIIIQILDNWKIVVPCNVKEIGTEKIKKRNLTWQFSTQKLKLHFKLEYMCYMNIFFAVDLPGCQCTSSVILKQKVWNEFQWKLK